MEENQKNTLFKQRNSLNEYIGYLIIGAIIAFTPLLAEIGLVKSSTVTVLGSVIFYSIVGIGLSILLGYSGLVSLGTAGFMGLGAYLTAYFTEDLGLPFVISVLISVAVPVLIGLIVGLVSLRIEGYYLAIATLGVSEILRRMFEEFDQYTNGFSGKNSWYPELFGVIELDKNFTFVLMTVILVVVMVLSHNFIHAQTGRALLTMRGSEAAAQAMGINLLRYKLTAFAIATLYAALGGVLYAHFITFTYPSTWTLLLSLNMVGVIVIGGTRSLYGAVLGSLIVFGVPEIILKQLPIIGEIEGLQYIMSGVLIIVVILFYPNGLTQLVRDLFSKAKNLEGKVNKVRKGDNNG